MPGVGDSIGGRRPLCYAVYEARAKVMPRLSGTSWELGPIAALFARRGLEAAVGREPFDLRGPHGVARCDECLPAADA